MSACRVRLSVIMTAWAVYIGPTLTSCDMAILSSCTSPEAVIHNNLFRYGMYCGPGPDDKLWTVTQPVDSIDQICQDHDKAYKSCLVVLSKDAGFDMPKILHQIMPVRGLIPAIITRTMFSVAPNYMLCMHKADKNLVLNFDNQIKGELLPKWWSNPAVAPTGTQGTKGFREACAFGFKGVCILKSRKLFNIMLELFRSSVDSDYAYASDRADIRAPENKNMSAYTPAYSTIIEHISLVTY